jgi:hypothetical protein
VAYKKLTDSAVTDAFLGAELPALQARAGRAGWVVDFERSNLTLTVDVIHRRTSLHFLLEGSLEGYRSLPPAWVFLHPTTRSKDDPSAWPTPPNPTPGGSASIFTSSGAGPVICLPCNRLAYAANRGPHADWNMENWVNQPPQHVTLCEMVSRIVVELQYSPGPLSERRG